MKNLSVRKTIFQSANVEILIESSEHYDTYAFSNSLHSLHVSLELIQHILHINLPQR